MTDFLIERSAPEIFVECAYCGGEGAVERWESASHWSFDPPCAIVLKCEHCSGAGGYICEAEGDQSGQPAAEGERS